MVAWPGCLTVQIIQFLGIDETEYLRCVENGVIVYVREENSAKC